MGKHMREKNNGLSLRNGHPGFSWNILHIIKYNHWRHVKKRLTHKRPDTGKDVAGTSNPGYGNSSGSNKKKERNYADARNYSTEDERTKQSTAAVKHSVAAKLRALIAEEISKKRARHKRSSTYPVRSHLTRSDSIHHLGPSDIDPLAELVLSGDTQGPIPGMSGNYLTTNTSDPGALMKLSDQTPPSDSETRESYFANKNQVQLEKLSLETTPGEVSKIIENFKAINTSDLIPPIFCKEQKIDDERCVEYQTVCSGDYLECNEVHKPQSVVDKTLVGELGNTKQEMVDERLIHAKILMGDASAHHIKDFLDALDIINMNRGLLLKLLQDPGSPLAHHFHNQQALNSKMGLTKSISFPLPGSSSGIASEPNKIIRKLEHKDPKEEEEEELRICNGEQESSHSESLEGSYVPVPPFGKCKVGARQDLSSEGVPSTSSSSSHSQNYMVIKRFKDLKQKLKHAIKENKKERRVTMDGILHKIPHGHRFSTDLKKEVLNQLKDPTILGEGKVRSDCGDECDLSAYSRIKCQKRYMSRASSLTESVERYCQLYQTSFNKEAKCTNLERLKLRRETGSPLRAPKVLVRLLSLPDIKTYIYRGEVSSHASSPKIPTTILEDDPMSTGSDSDEQKTLDLPIVSKSHQESDIVVEDTNQESFMDKGDEYSTTKDVGQESDACNDQRADVGLTMDDFGNLSRENDACIEHVIESLKESSFVAAEANPFFSPESHDKPNHDSLSISEDSIAKTRILEEENNLGMKHEASMDSPKVADKAENFQKGEVVGLRPKHDIDHLQLDVKDQAEFNYVREVLELSGFTRGFLGSWHSDDQPLDPSMCDEMEGCLLLDPDCSGNVEGGHCIHLLLFDLINEVLLEIYGRSYSYCPRPLSSLSRVRPMPAGNHILHQVWALIRWYLSSNSEDNKSLDNVVSRDLVKDDGWMNLQYDTECVGLELEDLIFDDLLEEVI